MYIELNQSLKNIVPTEFYAASSERLLREILERRVFDTWSRLKAGIFST